MAKTSTRIGKKQPSRRQSSAPTITVSHRLHALLHTVRAIARHEDDLCTLLHDTERNPELTPDVTKDLLHLLEKMPAEEYLDELRTLNAALRSSTTRKAPIQNPASLLGKRRPSSTRQTPSRTRKSAVKATRGRKPS